ncbi:hypothetical protein CLV92_108185 [Kineococcus xinjiangensis]|uniref:WD40 repeat protein n=1 Tax=Kineococcus xinjiangensis TaxID=512762 RepID=A0A2S6IJ79_9ACTN|nr:hypothetical protein [Kineococcus xinjiangensis]PPK94282.1 hypothetical protein CLV92_108185 [Kineococcus xinjiangensis]
MNPRPDPLEDSYRRMLRWFPPRYRQRREEELLSVLLDAAAPGQRRATAAERLDLLRAGSRAWSQEAGTAARRNPGPAAGIAALAATVLLTSLPAGPAPAAEPGTATLPSRFAGYSLLTGDASTDPPGRAAALYQQGLGVELVDFPQAVVVGAQADEYRRLDLAERRSSPSQQGDPAPMLLSPDGRSVAVGDLSGRPADVAVQDLTTGEVRTWPVGDAARTVPLALSPDGGFLALAVSGAPAHEEQPPGTKAALHLLDLRTGRVTTTDLAAPPVVAAWSPDGTELAVQQAAEGSPRPGETTVVLGADGRTRRHLDLPAGHRLAGPGAWSPDGRLLATGFGTGAYDASCPDQGCLVRPTTAVPARPGSTDAVPLPAVPAGATFLAWAGADRLLLAATDPPAGTGAESVRIDALSLSTQEVTPVSSIPTDGEFAVVRLHLATADLAPAVVREPGEAHRGRWPLPWRLAASALGALLVAAVVGRLTRRSGTRRTAATA